MAYMYELSVCLKLLNFSYVSWSMLNSTDKVVYAHHDVI
jgi:hypothetical protein